MADASADSLGDFLADAVAATTEIATDGCSGYTSLDAAGYEPLNLNASWSDATLRLPAVLQAYCDEFVFRCNRRTAGSIAHRFARLIEHAVQIQPTTYRALIGEPQLA